MQALALPQLLPAALMGAGTLMQMDAAEREADEKRTVMNRQMEREEKASGRAAELVQQEGQRYGQEQRMQDLTDRENQVFQRTSQDIAGAGGATIDAAGKSANVSEDFLKTKAARAIDESTRLTAIAREAAKTRAPGLLNMDDSLSMARLAGDTRNLWGTARNMNRAAGMQSAAVRAPAYGALGKIASSIGGSMMAGGGFGGGGGAELGEGVMSGVDGWDAALARAKPAKLSGGISF